MLKLLSNRKSRVKLVFVSGPVGVGKTAFSSKLFRFLSSKGYNVCYRRFTSFPLFSYLYFKFVATLLYGLKIVKMHEKVNIHPSTLFIMRNQKILKPITLMLVLLEVLSVTLSFCVKILFSCVGKEVIIVDEGIINMLANYLEVFNKNPFLLSFVVAFMKKLQRWFDLKIIYLDVRDDKVLLKRWIERRHPLPTTMVNLSQLIRYNNFIRLSKAIYRQAGYCILEVDTYNLKPGDALALIVKKLEL